MANPTDPRLLLACEWSEAQLQAAVVEMATLFGWRWTHFRPGMMRSGKWATPMQGHKGFPDLVLVRVRLGPVARVLFVELKSEKGKVAPEQHDWLQDLMMCTVEVYIWRPSDWQSGAIERVLKGEA